MASIFSACALLISVNLVRTFSLLFRRLSALKLASDSGPPPPTTGLCGPTDLSTINHHQLSEIYDRSKQNARTNYIYYTPPVWFTNPYSCDITFRRTEGRHGPLWSWRRHPPVMPARICKTIVDHREPLHWRRPRPARPSRILTTFLRSLRTVLGLSVGILTKQCPYGAARYS